MGHAAHLNGDVFVPAAPCAYSLPGPIAVSPSFSVLRAADKQDAAQSLVSYTFIEYRLLSKFFPLYSFESTALRLITSIGSAEFQPQFSRYFNDKSPGAVASNESEELNRVLILTLARSMHVHGGGDEMQGWCKDFLSNIIQHTPHSWPMHSLACFPPALNEYFTQNNQPPENKQQLKKAVEEEYRTWTSMTNENDIIAHFLRPTTNPLFLCLLFKIIWETENISPVAYKCVTL